MADGEGRGGGFVGALDAVFGVAVELEAAGLLADEDVGVGCEGMVS